MSGTQWIDGLQSSKPAAFERLLDTVLTEPTAPKPEDEQDDEEPERWDGYS